MSSHLLVLTPSDRSFRCEVHGVAATVPADFNPARPNLGRLEKFCDFAQSVSRFEPSASHLRAAAC